MWPGANKDGMSLDDHKGAAYVLRALMRQAQADIDTGGEIKPAVRKWKTAHPRKVLIGPFAARLLRFAKRKLA